MPTDLPFNAESLLSTVNIYFFVIYDGILQKVND